MTGEWRGLQIEKYY